MNSTMSALVYEAPLQMNMRQVPVPVIQPDEALIRVAYSGICGSELSGYEGKNSLRKPPLIMGHEFSGHIEAIGNAVDRPELKVGAAVTANPLVSCRQCRYCLSGKQQLCPKRKLLGAHLPGSNAEFVAIRADALTLLPPELSLAMAALVEPAACAIHAAALATPAPDEQGLVVGAGPIGLMVIQALADRGIKRIFCIDLNAERLGMAEKLGAVPGSFESLESQPVDIVVDAVGASATRQGCGRVVRSGGRIVWIGLHESDTTLPVNDFIRREITTYGSFAYTPIDFDNALQVLAQKRITLEDAWTQIEPLENGTACYEKLLHGAPISKIWLTPKE
ncbi:MAG: alcohol dehydrogenase catalytic domain-containing protein [Anaerolineales bacterium]